MSEAIWPMPLISETTFDGRFYEEFFPPEFYAEIFPTMGIAGTREELADFRFRHFQAVQEYFTAMIAAANAKTLKDENAKLDHVARDAERLMASLMALHEFGTTEAALAEELIRNPSSYQSAEGFTLAQFVNPSSPRPLFAVTAIISDIAASAERAQLRKAPSEIERRREIRQTIALRKPDETERLLQMDRLMPTIGLESGRREYRKKTDAPFAFVASFAGVWRHFNCGAFNSGHTVEGLKGTKSRAVDAVLLTIRRIDPACSRATVVTAFRNWEKASD